MTHSPATPHPLIGIDIGGTKTEAVALDTDNQVVATVRLPTVPGPDAVLDTAERAVRELQRQLGDDACGGIGIGLPGQLDRASGEIRNAYNMGIEHLAIGPLLAARTGIDTSIDNDVTAATIGAAHLLGLDGSVAYLNLGTGLAGIVVDGVPLRGSHGVAGEIGHLPVSSLARPCPCGQTGCLETQTSGSALRRHWLAGGDDPGPLLLAAIAGGDNVARQEFDNLVVEGAAMAVRLLALTVDPDSVVIGGGLRLLGAPLIDGVRQTLDRWSAESPFLAGLGLSSRLRVLPEASPAAAVGAALATTR